MTTVSVEATGTSVDNDFIKKQLDDGKKNLSNAIKLHRNDIVVSLINEWFKLFDASSVHRYFFSENFCDNNSKTALHLAFELNDIDILRTLLNFNANPAIKDNINNKNLTELINSSKNNKMKQILNDSLLQAIAQNNLVQVQNFIDSGIDLNSTETILDNNSYLHWVFSTRFVFLFIFSFICNVKAVLYSSENVVKCLLDNSANVNILNKFGASALHDAVYKRKDLNIIEMMLLSGKRAGNMN